MSAPSSSRTRKSGVQQKVIYRVQSGDTLWGIGRQFSVQTRDIRQWNALDEDHILHPGDKLTLLVRNGKRS